jgi:hypothetical protein
MTTMNSSEPGVPTALRERVIADLRPVRPLADPWKRGLVLVPLAVALMVAVHMRFGTRADLGAAMLWGLSLLQIVAGLATVAAALREVIPDRALSTPVRIALFAGGLGLAIGVTYLAWHASGTTAPAAMRYRFWKACLQHTIEVGLPVLLAILLLAARGVMWRPALVGGLAGLAAGLIADASWRTFCDVAEPSHVLTAHVGGIVALAILGAAMAKVYAWLAGVH